MKRTLSIIALFHFYIFTFCFRALAQDTLWVRYDDRFRDNTAVRIADVDSFEIKNGQVMVDNKTTTIPIDAADMLFKDPGRILLKPNSYRETNYTSKTSKEGYNFSHSLESEHFAVFWDVRFGNDPSHLSIGGQTASASNILGIAERCWKTYVEELGFLVPGQSTTDHYKIQLYVPYQSEWRADASGDDGQRPDGSWSKTGLGHFNPWAANARGGHTIAHEVGHTFQYLVSADLGMEHGFNYGYGDGAGGGNGWWESCADWQAYKIFPDRQFTDGEYFEGHLPLCHLNLMHEDWRYQNCFVQDYWCMKHGQDFIGRLWRESRKPEDPIEAYQRLCGLTLQQFADEQMEGFMRMATWDIDGVREAAAHRIGQHRNCLKAVGNGVWRVDAAYCPQNFGYNITNMKTATAGTTVNAHFKGIAGADGYSKIKTDKAGWRYAFVALMNTGERIYGDIQQDKEGTATLTIPTNKGTCRNLFFIVMGAPTQYWRHPWDNDASNDEQWPYEVTFENTQPK